MPIALFRMLLLCASFLIFETSKAQCYKDFKYAIGTSGADEAFDIVNAGNGDFFVVGTTVDGTGKNVLVTKMNFGGAVLWTKVYGGTGTETVKKASSTHDNGLLITGSTGSFGNNKGDIMCLKIDNSGNLIWLRKFGTGSATGDVGMDVIETADGGYAVTGALNALSSSADMIVIKLDANANIIWSKRFDHGALESGVGIIENANNLIVTSEVQVPGSDYESIITEINEVSGNVINSIKLHPSAGGLNNAYIFHDASNNGYWISGHLTDKSQASKMQQVAIKLDDNFAITKTYKLVIPEYANSGYSGFQSLKSGGFIACAGQESSSSGFIYNIRNDGSIGFAKKLVGGHDRKLTRLQLINGKIISVGSDLRSGGNQEIFLIAFDSSGNNIPPCQTDTADLIVQSQSFISSAYSWSTINSISFNSINANFTTGTIVLNQTLLCSIACPVDTIPSVDFSKPDSVCVGSKITIANKTTGGKTFKWNFNADNNINQPSILASSDSMPPEITYTNAGMYKISLLVNEGLSTQVSISKNITVVESPYKSSFINTSLCRDDSIILKTSLPYGTFFWTDGTINQELIVKSQGIYWAETNFYGCVIRDSFNVSQNAPVKIDIIKDTTICDGRSVQLYATGNNLKVYSWAPANTLTDGSSISPLATPRETTSYTLKVTDGNGCTGIDSIKIFVKPSPFVITSQDSTVCSSDRVKLSTISSSDVTYNWSPSTGLSNITGGGAVATPATSTKYTVTVTAANGCIASDSVYLTVKQSPSIAAATTDDLVCSGTPAHLAVTSSSPVTYKWSPSAYLDNDATATPIAKPLSTTNFVVEATSANGCKVYDTVLVNVKPAANFSIEPSLITVCKNTPVILKASGGNTYNWLPSKTITAIDGGSVIVQPNANTDYKVIIQDTVCATADTLTATVNIAGLSTMHATKSNDVDCIRTSSNLSAAGGIRYRWFPSVNLSDSTSANPVATPLQTTTYHVQITNAGGCITTDSVTVYVYKGLIENGYQLPTAFTPNNDGNNDCFSVRKWGALTNLDFSIYNRSGHLMFHTNNPSDCWDGTSNGKRQETGTYIYIVRAQAGCGVVDRKGTVVLLR